MPCFLGKAQLGPLAVKWILDLTSHCSSGSKGTVTELSCGTLSLSRGRGLGTAEFLEQFQGEPCVQPP